VTNRRQTRPLFPKLHEETQAENAANALVGLGATSAAAVAIGARGVSGFLDTLPLLDIAFVIVMMALVHL
jgi:hypothetical protein